MAQLGQRNLRDTITHWPNTGSNGFGGYTFGTPVTLEARWEQRQELFVNPDGNQELSKAVVYLPSDVEIGDYLVEGDSTSDADPTIVTGAFRVKAFSRVTDLSKLTATRKAMM